MARRWLVGLVGAFAVLVVAGIGFAAFSASATVSGQARAGTVQLTITDYAILGCYYPTGAPAPGTFDLLSINGAGTVLSASIGNLTPGAVCSFNVFIVNTGTVPLSISAQLNETLGICGYLASNCYNPSDAFGLTAYGGVTTALVAPSVAPTALVVDTVSVGIPAGSVTVPSVGVFSIYYVGTSGL